jgi:hypothetical protein
MTTPFSPNISYGICVGIKHQYQKMLELKKLDTQKHNTDNLNCDIIEITKFKCALDDCEIKFEELNPAGLPDSTTEVQIKKFSTNEHAYNTLYKYKHCIDKWESRIEDCTSFEVTEKYGPEIQEPTKMTYNL